MARWRDVKKGNVEASQEKKSFKKENSSNKTSLAYAPTVDRIKAFITDMFMIMMPIMYITTYLVMDGKESFQASDSAHWITMGIYGAITVAFWVLKGQTPGFKAYSIKLVSDDTQETLGILGATVRYILFLVSAVTIVGFLLPFFRKDNKTFQDVVMRTSVIKLPD